MLRKRTTKVQCLEFIWFIGFIVYRVSDFKKVTGAVLFDDIARMNLTQIPSHTYV